MGEQRLNDGRRRGSTHWMLAVLAACTATIGDVLMLSVARGAAWVHSGSGNAPMILSIGGIAGLAIPAYYLGYRQATIFLHGEKSLARKIILYCGIAIGLFGALTHVLTAFDIHSALERGMAIRLPAESFTPSASALFVAGSISAACALMASIVFVWKVFNAPEYGGRIPALLNPVLGTAVLSALAALSGHAGDYLGPIAPNLAHLVFFSACWISAPKHQPA